MMKRIGAACIALALCLLMKMPCFAATLTQAGESEDIDVYARYFWSSDVYTAPVEDGEASVTLGEGTVVTASGVSGSGLWLVVYPIPEKDAAAWNWFEDCMMPYGTNIYPMEIYFADQDGNRVEAGSAAVIAVEHGKNDAETLVFNLAVDGTATELAGSTEANRIVFSMLRNGYYVLAEDLDEPGNGKPDDGDDGEPGDGDDEGPDDGDDGGPDDGEDGEPDGGEDGGPGGGDDGGPDDGKTGASGDGEKTGGSGSGSESGGRTADGQTANGAKNPALPAYEENDAASGGASDLSPGGISQGGGAATGDESGLRRWICIFTGALLIIAFFIRRHMRKAAKR